MLLFLRSARLFLLTRMLLRWKLIARKLLVCFHDLFKTARCILVSFPSSICSKRFFSIQVVPPFNSIDTALAWKYPHFLLIRDIKLQMVSICQMHSMLELCVHWYRFHSMRYCYRCKLDGLLTYVWISPIHFCMCTRWFVSRNYNIYCVILYQNQMLGRQLYSFR